MENTQEIEIIKIDPVFVLSNHQKIEIFSTDTYEPWTFSVGRVRGLYCHASRTQSL